MELNRCFAGLKMREGEEGYSLFEEFMNGERNVLSSGCVSRNVFILKQIQKILFGEDISIKNRDRLGTIGTIGIVKIDNTVN